MPEKPTNKLNQIVDAISWWMDTRKGTCAFVPNDKGNGSLMPEFDVWYTCNGRRVTKMGIANLMASEFYLMDYRFTLSQVIAGLWYWTWTQYLEQQAYPEHWAIPRVPKAKGPRGRPRKVPKTQEAS